MQHLDEGTIHAWLDGALPPAEAAAVEQHAASCAACAALVAEARGLLAASSRIVHALDGGVSGTASGAGAATFAARAAEARRASVAPARPPRALRLRNNLRNNAIVAAGVAFLAVAVFRVSRVSTEQEAVPEAADATVFTSASPVVAAAPDSAALSPPTAPRSREAAAGARRQLMVGPEVANAPVEEGVAASASSGATAPAAPAPPPARWLGCYTLTGGPWRPTAPARVAFPARVTLTGAGAGVLAEAPAWVATSDAGGAARPAGRWAAAGLGVRVELPDDGDTLRLDLQPSGAALGGTAELVRGGTSYARAVTGRPGCE